MTILKKWLEKKKALIADGGWGTELFKRGLKPGEVPEGWNIDRPEDVRAVAASYVTAGADIILTNTFGGSPLKLAKVGFGTRTAEINRLGAENLQRGSGRTGPCVRVDGADRGIHAAPWNCHRNRDGERLCGAGKGPRGGRG